MKTRKVAKVDLTARCFGIVLNPEDTASWFIPLEVLGSEEKTLAVLQTMHANFDTMHIPTELRQEAWSLLRGALMTRGIRVDRRTFEQQTAASALPVSAHPVGALPVSAPCVSPVNTHPVDEELKELEALADYRATAFLKQLGLE
jgi:hypothetical protein